MKTLDQLIEESYERMRDASTEIQHHWNGQDMPCDVSLIDPIRRQITFNVASINEGQLETMAQYLENHGYSIIMWQIRPSFKVYHILALKVTLVGIVQ